MTPKGELKLCKEMAKLQNKPIWTKSGKNEVDLMSLRQFAKVNFPEDN